MKTRELNFTLVDQSTGISANDLTLIVTNEGECVESINVDGKNYFQIGDIELFVMALIGKKNFQAMVERAFKKDEPEECEITAFKNSSLGRARKGF